MENPVIISNIPSQIQGDVKEFNWKLEKKIPQTPERMCLSEGISSLIKP